jgi:hypothetical protein
VVKNHNLYIHINQAKQHKHKKNKNYNNKTVQKMNETKQPTTEHRTELLI